MSNGQSYFHKINKELTINLAEVAAVFDHTEHITGLADRPEYKVWATEKLESGQTCLVRLRPATEKSPYGFNQVAVREFRITRAEMTVLQDALGWYSRNFTKTE